MTSTLESRTSAGPQPIPEVRNRISLEQSVANTLTMAYRGLLKIKHNPSNCSTSSSSRSSSR